MKKTLLLIMIILICGGNILTAREHEDFYRQYIFISPPEMSSSYPQKNVNSLLIASPVEVVQFFNEKGIDLKYLGKECAELPEEIRQQMNQICSDCQKDLCCALKTATRPYMNTHYDAIVVRIGDAYWTVWT